jgi:hypothetical protein
MIMDWLDAFSFDGRRGWACPEFAEGLRVEPLSSVLSPYGRGC